MRLAPSELIVPEFLIPPSELVAPVLFVPPSELPASAVLVPPSELQAGLLGLALARSEFHAILRPLLLLPPLLR